MAQVDRLSVTMAPEIGAAVREAASRAGVSVSTWIASAAAEHAGAHQWRCGGSGVV